MRNAVPPDALIAEAAQVARDLPVSVLQRFARELSQLDVGDDGPPEVPSLGGDAGNRLRGLGQAWLEARGPRTGGELVAALLAASDAAQREREEERVDLVWTGPQGERLGLLRIEQSLLDLIDGARSDLLLVTFVAFEVPDLRAALARAAERGVAVRVVAEHPGAEGGKADFDPLDSLLGGGLRDKVRAYVWPAVARPVSERQTRGTLHAKAAVADGRELLISSANFTGHGLALNMELGVRILGGRLPEQVRAHFEDLIRRGVLTGV